MTRPPIDADNLFAIGDAVVCNLDPSIRGTVQSIQDHRYINVLCRDNQVRTFLSNGIRKHQSGGAAVSRQDVVGEIPNPIPLEHFTEPWSKDPRVLKAKSDFQAQYAQTGKTELYQLGSPASVFMGFCLFQRDLDKPPALTLPASG